MQHFQCTIMTLGVNGGLLKNCHSNNFM